MARCCKQLANRLPRGFAIAEHYLPVRQHVASALFTFFSRMIEQAAMKKRVADLLDQDHVEVSLPDAMRRLERAVGRLLQHAQQAGTVDRGVRLPEVMALLISLCQGALAGGWNDGQQQRVLAIVYAGLRTPAGSAPDRTGERPTISARNPPSQALD